MAEPRWQGEFWLASDFCLLAGVSGDARSHTHYAHQVMPALDGVLRLSVAGQPLSGRGTGDKRVLH